MTAFATASCAAISEEGEVASKLARAAHDRIDRLLLGRAEAARKRVCRLLGDAIEQPGTGPVLIACQSPAEREAAAQADDVRSRVAALLAAS